MKIQLKNVRLAFPAIWKPYKGKGEEGNGKFNLKAILPKNHPQIKELEAAFVKIAAEKWTAKAVATLKAIKVADKTCLHDGDAKPEWEGFEGNLYVSASNKVRPSAFNFDRTELSEADGVIYSGCMVNVNIELWAQDNDYGKRINATLRGVQFCGDNDAFSGGATAADADEFDELGNPDGSGGEAEDDPAA